MAVGWETFRDDDLAAPSTQYIFAAMGYDGAERGTVASAYFEAEPVSFAGPDELQDGVIEPTALYKKTGRIYYDVFPG